MTKYTRITISPEERIVLELVVESITDRHDVLTDGTKRLVFVDVLTNLLKRSKHKKT